MDDLKSVISGVCKMVAYYELVSQTERDSQLYTILSATVEDSCHWVHNIIIMSHIVDS